MAGKNQTTVMHCFRCGSELPEGARFCPGCGGSIEAAPRAARPLRQASTGQSLPRPELAAALAARQELDGRMEPELVDSFLARIEQRIDSHVDQRLRAGGAPVRARIQQESDKFGLTLGIASVVLGIPLTAISGGTAGFAGLLVTWTGIAAVNAAFNLRKRP